MTDSPSSSESNFLLQAREASARNVPAVIVTVVRGATVGAKLLLIGDDAQGTLGTKDLDDAGLTAARDAVASGKSGLVALAADTDAFVDVFLPPPLLVLIGAVHVAQAVVTFAAPLGFRIVVVDARQTLATRERFPDVDDLIVAWPDEAYPRLPITRSSAIVILTHDPKFDEPAILGALQTDAGYIGAVGSRKTNVDRRARLLEAGATGAQIDRVHGPIGLDIGGNTPEEMAISILAEIIASRNDRSGGPLKGATGSIRGDGD
ncbi:MAG: XdhC family protein [Chloroflexia bacterium]|nr:XdhC family protein [Chloroflexia bacterium]